MKTAIYVLIFIALFCAGGISESNNDFVSSVTKSILILDIITCIILLVIQYNIK